MAKIIKLGSLYFDGQPQETGARYDSGRIAFGPAIPGKELQWVKVNGLLVADRCVCINVSWEQLDSQGLVFGTLVQIDGQFYLFRCLKVGAQKDASNEWDAALDETGESNDLWHWENQYFWGQETPKDWASNRAVRGFHSARDWLNSPATNRFPSVGFRPALEPLGSGHCSPDALIGKTIRLYGPGWAALEGHLLDADDYDFTLVPTAGAPTRCFWASKAGDNLVVSRDSILWFTEA